MDLKTFKSAAQILVGQNLEKKNKVMITISEYDHKSGDYDINLYANHMGSAVLALLFLHMENLFKGIIFGGDDEEGDE